MTNLIYILAASHSGSTLLAMLLGAHQEICTIGELKATHLGDPEKYLCSCGENIQKCQFHHKLRESLASRGFDFDITKSQASFRSINTPYIHWLMGPLYRNMLLETIRDFGLFLSPTWRERSKQVKTLNLRLIEALTDLTNTKYVVDSSKIAIRLKFLLQIPELNVRVIHLIRDGRAVALTYMNPAIFADAKNPRMRGGGAGGNRDNEKLNVKNASHQWKRCLEEQENILRELNPNQKIRISYEQLCSEPKQTLSKLFNFLGLEPDKMNFDFRSAEQHVIGNGMRLDSSSEIKLDERWKSELTKQQLQIFEQFAGQKNNQYGY